MDISCSFIVFGTAAWKLMPLMIESVLADVANLVVMLTILGLLASIVGVKEMTRPLMGEVKAVSDADCAGAAAVEGDGELEEKRSVGMPGVAAAAVTGAAPPPKRLMMSSAALRVGCCWGAGAAFGGAEVPIPPKISAKRSWVVCADCLTAGEAGVSSPVKSSRESLSALVLPTARFSETE